MLEEDATADSADPAVSRMPTDGSPEIEELARLFPSYEILRLLGRGGMGAVYQARQPELDRLVAIKLLPLEISGSHDFAERFRREARAMAKLNHPNILTVFEFGTTAEGHLFFIMEYVDGANLHDIIQEVGLNVDQALSVTEQICAALGYAHGKGVVHRDIKPANVMIDRESNVKVADFGLARLIDQNGEQFGGAPTAVVFGTPDYMAPEQMRNMDVDHRADIYSLGVITYEMLCGEVPRGAFQPPSQRTGCDPCIDQIVIKAMQQSPDLRYQSTQEMEAAVAAARTPSSPAEPVPLPGPQGRGALAKWVGIGVAAGVGAVLFLVFAPGKKPAPRTASAPLPNPRPAAVTTEPVAPVASVPAAPAPAAEAAPVPVTPVAIVPEIPAIPRPAAEVPPAPVTPVATVPEIPAIPTPANSAATPAPKSGSEVVKTENEVAKWLADTDAQQQEAFQKQATKPYDDGVAGLRARYLAALDAGLAKASAAGQLEQALVWRTERQSFAEAQTVAADHAATPPEIRALRASFRQSLTQLEQERAARSKALHASYDAVLLKYITLLTQRGRLDDALLLQTKRKEVSLAWLGSDGQGSSQKPPAATPGQTPAGVALPTSESGLRKFLIGTEWATVRDGSKLVFLPDGRNASYKTPWGENRGAQYQVTGRRSVTMDWGSNPIECELNEACTELREFGGSRNIFARTNKPTALGSSGGLGMKTPGSSTTGFVKPLDAPARTPASSVVRRPRDPYGYGGYFGDRNPGTPAPAHTSGGVSLLDLKPESSEVGNGQVALGGAEYLGGRVMVNGEPCEKWVGASAPSRLVYKLPLGVRAFSATGVGTTSESYYNSGTWVYVIKVDGKEIFRSPEVGGWRTRSTPMDVRIPAGSNKLELIVEDQGNSKNAHSVWALPMLWK